MHVLAAKSQTLNVPVDPARGAQPFDVDAERRVDAPPDPLRGPSAGYGGPSRRRGGHSVTNDRTSSARQRSQASAGVDT